MRLAFTFLGASCFVTQVFGEVQTREISYEHDGTELKGVLAWDDEQSGPRPAVLVVHEWWGLNDYAQSRAKQLAELGYVAFALDMYGADKTTTHPQEAGEWASQIRSNRENWRARAMAGLNVLREQEQTDKDKVMAIGYCFGGSTVLQLAYAGAPVLGVASFHGALMPPEEGVDVTPSILICHGAADEFVPFTAVQTTLNGLEQAGAAYTFVAYSGAKHGFTNPDAGNAGIEALAYQKRADEESWEQMQLFFQDLLNGK